MRIVIADDDPDVRALAARALLQEFPDADLAEVTDLPGLQGALNAAPPDVFVTDLDLRWSSGFDLFEMVRQQNSHCCFVMFTGTGNEEIAVRAIKAGFEDYLVKGSKQFRRLAASVRAGLQRRQERRELEENRDLLMKELYHRLHNNLQIVISLMHMSARSLKDEEARSQIRDLARRIQALSTLQEQFYRSPDFRQVEFAPFLEQLARDLMAFAGGRITLRAELDSVRLPVNTAVLLGLIANELITNVVKHAFPGNLAGNMMVRLHAMGGSIVLLVADDGAGMGLEPQGLGHHLIDRLAAQLGADVAIARGSPGTECRVTFSA